MKTKQPAGAKKQTVTLKDLTTKKNPKGGAKHVSNIKWTPGKS